MSISSSWYGDIAIVMIMTMRVKIKTINLMITMGKSLLMLLILFFCCTEELSSIPNRNRGVRFRLSENAFICVFVWIAALISVMLMALFNPQYWLGSNYDLFRHIQGGAIISKWVMTYICYGQSYCSCSIMCPTRYNWPTQPAHAFSLSLKVTSI